MTDYPITQTDAECDRFLDALPPPETLARFLGASSRVWTRARRDRLAAQLASSGFAGLREAISAASDCHRQEVIDEVLCVIRFALRNAMKGGFEIAKENAYIADADPYAPANADIKWDDAETELAAALEGGK